jgi:uncharacterized protein
MPKTWKLSRYTALVTTPAGDLILHNSFMGALALIPSVEVQGLERLFVQGVTEDDLKNSAAQELCDGGFFCPADLDEQAFVWDTLAKEDSEPAFNIIALTTDLCNFSCEYCYETHERGAMRRGVVEGLKKLVEGKAPTVRRLSVSWFGGEPLVAQNVIWELSRSFIDSCSKAGSSYSADITTNGYLLSPATVNRLLASQVRRIQVTIDGAESSHNRNRHLVGGGGTYRRIVDNLKHMRTLADDFHVSIRVNFNDESIPTLGEFFDEISTLFGGDPRFGLYMRPIGKWGGPNDSQLSVCDPKESKLIETRLTTDYAGLGALDKVVKTALNPHGRVCYASKPSSVIVGPDGTIYKCSVAFDDIRNQVGRLTESGELELNQSRWDLWVSNGTKDMTRCHACTYGPTCQGRSCPRNSLDADKPVCPMNAREYEQLVQLATLCGRDGAFS